MTTDQTSRWLEDFLENARAVDRLVARGKSAYDGDEMLRYAAEDLLIRLGDTVTRIERSASDFIDAHPELELRRVKDARNVVAHGYDVVDPEIVWSILERNIPQVSARIEDLLRR